MRKGVIKSISELALWVSDVESAAQFYTEKLGFETDSIDPGHNAFLKSGDFLLVLFDRQSPNTALANDYLALTGGPQGDVYHAAFKVNLDDLDTLAESIAQGGIQVKGPVDFPNGRRSFFFVDADQHYIELTDR